MSSGTSGSRWSRLSSRKVDALVGGAAVALIVLLVLVGLQLSSSQSGARERVIARFQDRAQVISALTQAILGSAGNSQATAQRYGGTVDQKLMDQAVSQQHLAYATLLDAKGDVIAQSSTLTAQQRRVMLSAASLKPVLGGAPVTLSDVHPGGPDGNGIIDLAVSFATAQGRRVLVTGLPSASLGPFLGSYLRRVPTRGGTAYVLDSKGVIVGARDAKQKFGHEVVDAGLFASIGERETGPYGDDRYFAAADVPTSTWRVVMTSSKETLFSSVSGSRVWLPWVLFVALGVFAVGFLVLLRRLLGSRARLVSSNQVLSMSNAKLESTNALLRHAAELARSNAELEQFASIASHDLQEPLRKVQTFAAQLTATETERLSPEGQDFLRRMNDAAGRMRTLIDDLLAYSRVSTKGRPFVPVDVGDVVRQTLIDLEVTVQSSGAEVSVGDLPTINADPVQMGQLMQNLIGNALKFTRSEVTPEIHIDGELSDGVALLTIRDNGIGFDEQYATRIFRAFERLHGASAYPGTGIGLALCHKIVERHHGTIVASSEFGQGATFTIRIPVDQAAESPAPTSLFPEPMENEVTHALV